MISEERIKELKKLNEQKSRRQDNKQHCQKILKGIGAFDNTTAERAIWELIQNARDLSNQAHIQIELDNDKLTFSHHGKPFNYETFTSLIKQVSSEEKEDPNAAGQFGTGFMTTHKFSRKIRINGCMELDKDLYAEINDFILDRTSNELQPMIDAMVKQLEFVDDLFNGPTSPTPRPKTSFIYELDDAHFPAAQQGVTAAFDLMPYVMAINERIEKVSIDDRKNNKQQIFIKKDQHTVDAEIGLCSMNIETSTGDRTLYYLQSEDRKDLIILPLKSLNEAIGIDGIPRLFIYFPLLGTHTFGFNYILHSERFFPEEPRNAIVLPEDNIDKQYKYEANVQIIEGMLEMLFRFLDKYGSRISNARLIAPVTIDMLRFANSHKLTSDFYANLKKRLVEKYQTIPFLSINGEAVSVSQSDKVRFLAPDIVKFLRNEEGEKYLDVVYSYAKFVSNMPSKDEVLDWSEIVAQWNDTITSRFITIDDIVNAITQQADNCRLHEFLLFLKDSGQTSYFVAKELIPNREGVRRKAYDLQDAKDIPSELFDVCKLLIPGETAKFVDPVYEDVYDFTKYSRENLKKSINDYVSTQKNSPEAFHGTLPALLDYCLIFPVQNGTSQRNRTMPYICEFFGHTYKEKFVAPLQDVSTDTEQNLYKGAFEVLVEYMLKKMQEKGKCVNPSWYENNKELHYNILASLSNPERPTEYQTKTFKNYAIVPNQEGTLCLPDKLNVISGRNNIPSDKLNGLLDLYQKVFKSSYQSKLIEERYAWMFAYEGIDPKKIGSEIDEVLQESQYQNPITVEIIDYLDRDEENGYWHKWFNNIEQNKPKIFLNRLQGDERAHTYKFMKASPGQKKQIAELVEDPNFETIISKAREYLQNEQDKQLMFEHMYNIGKAIEEKLRERLRDELLQVDLRNKDEIMEINDIQNGQDIVIRYNGNVVYYVEVKSKWNFDQPAHMSTNQMRQAVLNADRYALCCVDLTSYSANIANSIDTQTILNNTYVHLDIGDVLGRFIETIVKDEEDEENNLKISNYQSNLNKGFFKRGNKGLDSLIDDIVKKCTL